MLLITITGPSGSGKDTAARLLSDMTGIPVLVSYTTRPIREGELQGREHHFVSECNTPRTKMLAYTEFGGYQYWTTLDQLTTTVPKGSPFGSNALIYVIDEEGLRNLPEDIKTIKVLVTANPEIRLQRGITEERMQRDSQRTQLPPQSFDFKIQNNKSLAALKHKVRALAVSLST